MHSNKTYWFVKGTTVCMFTSMECWKNAKSWKTLHTAATFFSHSTNILHRFYNGNWQKTLYLAYNTMVCALQTTENCVSCHILPCGLWFYHKTSPKVPHQILLHWQTHMQSWMCRMKNHKTLWLLCHIDDQICILET